MSTSNKFANAIRALTMDAVQAAGSGHPGAPMGMADLAWIVWRYYLKHDPANPDWPDRDRFVLSNGHGSMLLYSLLHLTGYDLGIEDIKAFRQLHSKTPGHPEYRETPGVETTTGPLGQGFANAVGMALAEKMLAAEFNPKDHQAQKKIVDHRTWVFLGDGCLMEGVSHEAASLAGTWKLGKLICLYDDNGISIDGEVKGWFTEDTASRFRSYGWQVIESVDGHDHDAIHKSIGEALQETDRPTLICCKTVIGYGAPNKSGTAGVHGSPLGKEEIESTRAALGWPYGPFEIPEDIYQAWDCRKEGETKRADWLIRWKEFQGKNPSAAAELERRWMRNLVDGWDNKKERLIEKVVSEEKSLASRSASGEVIAQLAGILPELVGGSADLSGSNCTIWPDARIVTGENAAGNYIYYGVREFGMTAISNGMVLHGGYRPFTGTFLIFMEYGRNAVRMSALMGIPNIYIYTHDSIGQGEDGPTHQPVEQIANLRGTPNLSVWRPCDAVETAVSWCMAIENTSGPTALILSRQNLPHQIRDPGQVSNISRGAYILRDSENEPELLLIATGSEVALALEAEISLAKQGVAVRVISMPSADVFQKQDKDYREKIIPDHIRARVAVEAAGSDYWYKWVGLDGKVIGMKGFGLSAPGSAVYKALEITADKVVEAGLELLGKSL